jgi:hypothetical protein
MTRHGQLGLFGESQPELPDVGRTAAGVRADPDEAPAELLRVLTKVPASQSFPWEARRTLYWRTVFPQMTNWLPHEEAAQLRFEFETEIRRLEAAWIFGEAGRKRQRSGAASLISAKQGIQIPCSREDIPCSRRNRVFACNALES